MTEEKRDSPTTESAAEGDTRDRALEDAREFVDELAKLRETDPGRLADLRRNAGNTLPGRKTAWFYEYLRSKRRQRHAEIYFLVATLYDLNRFAPVDGAGDLGRALQVLAERMAPTATPDEARRRFRRFHLLLDADFDRIRDPFDEEAPWQDGGGELAFRLRQMVRLLASKEIGVDWAQLLVDLCWWSHPDRFVQKKWARSFFGAAVQPKQTSLPPGAPPKSP